MSTPTLPPFRTADDGAGDPAAVPLGVACGTWAGAWMAGQVVASAVAVASGKDTLSEAGAGWLLATAIAGWAPLLYALWALGKRFGIGSFASDWGLSFRWSDLAGIPLGLLTQLALVPLLYWPLERAWPGTFNQDRVQERAKDMWSSTSGAGVVLLVLVVVVGAPLVEELVYRGLLQGAFVRRVNEVVAVVAVAAWFALIHFQWIEIPGLFVVGLVLGIGALFTRRLGLSIVTHMAFNATGLVLVAFA